MVGKKSSKRSALYSKGTNSTIDQFFTVKKKSMENDTPLTTNENHTKNSTSLSSDISKQQQQQQQKTKVLLPSPSPSISLSDKKGTTLPSIKQQQRRPLATIDGKSSNALPLMPTTKPAKSNFTVLRDDDIERGATEAEMQQTQTRHEQSDLLPPLANNVPDTPLQQQRTINKNSTTQQQATALKDNNNNDDDDDDTQDSQASSFFGDDNDSGIEFRVDALDSDDDDDTVDDGHATTSSFFDDDDDDDEEEAPFLTKTHRRTHLPTVTTTPSIPNKRALETKDEKDTHKVIKTSNSEDITTSLLPSTDDKNHDNQAIDNKSNTTNTLEFSISNSLTIPLNVKDNYHSEDEDDDTESPSPPSIRTKVSSTSRQTRSESSSSPQIERTQSPSRSSELSTLPMSLPTDESLDIHVAYPEPRGKHVIDKFGH